MSCPETSVFGRGGWPVIGSQRTPKVRDASLGLLNLRFKTPNRDVLLAACRAEKLGKDRFQEGVGSEERFQPHYRNTILVSATASDIKRLAFQA